jgi:hypothetical protein
MADRLVGRCDCGHPTYLLAHAEWCPCEDCHPGGRLYRSDPSGAPTLAGTALPRTPRDRTASRQSVGRGRGGGPAPAERRA